MDAMSWLMICCIEYHGSIRTNYTRSYRRIESAVIPIDCVYMAVKKPNGAVKMARGDEPDADSSRRNAAGLAFIARRINAPRILPLTFPVNVAAEVNTTSSCLNIFVDD